MAAPTQSRSLNLIQSVAWLPLMQKASDLVSHIAAVFEYAASDRRTRFAAIAIATMLTAGGIWGFNFMLSRVPIYFVKRTLLPTCQWACKASLAWLIFTALGSASDQTRSDWYDDDDIGGGFDHRKCNVDEELDQVRNLARNNSQNFVTEDLNQSNPFTLQSD